MTPKEEVETALIDWCTAREMIFTTSTDAPIMPKLFANLSHCEAKLMHVARGIKYGQRIG